MAGIAPVHVHLARLWLTETPRRTTLPRRVQALAAQIPRVVACLSRQCEYRIPIQQMKSPKPLRVSRRALEIVEVSLLLLSFFIIPTLAAQPTPDTVARPVPLSSLLKLQTPTLEEIQARIAEIESDKTLGDDRRKRLVQTYELAIAQLEEAQKTAAAAKSFQESIDTAPSQTDNLRTSIETAPASNVERENIQRLAQTLSDKELEQRLSSERAQLTVMKTQLDDLLSQLAKQRARPAAARQEQVVATTKLQELEEALAALAPLESEGELVIARRTVILARLEALSAFIRMIEQEIVSYAVRLQLLTARRDHTKQQFERAEARILQLQKIFGDRREADAAQVRRKMEQAEREAVDKHSAVQGLARENAALSQQLTKLIADVEKKLSQRERVDELLKNLEGTYNSFKQKIETGAEGEILQEMVRRYRQVLVDVTQIQRNFVKRRRQISEAQLELLRTDERHQKLVNVAQHLDQLMTQQVDPNLSPETREEIRSELLGLLKHQDTLFNKLTEAHRRHVLTLVDLEHKEVKLIDLNADLNKLFERQLLWTQAPPIYSIQWITNVRSSLTWLLAPENWFEVSRTFFDEVRDTPAMALGMLLGFMWLLGLRKRFKRKLRSIATQVDDFFQSNFKITLQALFITLLLAAPWPFLLVSLGWLLSGASDDSEFASHVGKALLGTSPLLLYLTFLRRSCQPKGLADMHFRWSMQTRRVLWRELRWLTPVVVSAILVILATDWPLNYAHRDAFGRIAFFVVMGAIAYFLWRTFRPQSGVTASLIGSDPKGWRWALQYVVFPLLVAIPFVLILLGVFGYSITAFVIGVPLADTLMVIGGAVLLHSLAERWLTVLMPKLALSRAQAKREAVAAAKARKDAGEGTPDNLVITEVNLATIGRHTKRWLSMLIVVYLIAALGLVWYELFPALGALEVVELWSYETKLEGVEQLVPITLWDLVLAVVIAILAILVSRNLPGVLEITVLKHVSLLDAGMRYAITYLSRYGILTAGIVLFFKFIGVGWGQLQWLIAALSVGLGFGLREIFADYVSGLIILFERPMRVGDTVTVGGAGADATHGTVSRIRIRTTTVTDWDNKELVIPNKAFVTDQLINWTLSSPVTRVIVPVRIAFGSDTTLAYKVMLDVAKSNPLVLEEPEPTVLFLGFGDNSYDFEMRAFVRESSQRLTLIHELHMAVERALREHDIEIPYPQRDVHVHAVETPLNPLTNKPHINPGLEE